MTKQILGCVMLASVFTAQADLIKITEKEAYEIKIKFEKKMYQLKIEKENELLVTLGKQVPITPMNLAHQGIHSDCSDWVYKGPGSREEAAEACRGVENLACLDWVYKGPGSRIDAARSCAGVELVACAEWVYKGPGSRQEAANACKGVTDMECVEKVFRGPGSRAEAARACGYSDGGQC